MTLLKASKLSLFLLFPLMQSCIEGHIDFAGEIVCRNVDGGNLCPKLSHFNSELHLRPSNSTEAKLGYDVSQSRKTTWYDSLDLRTLTLPPRKSWLSDYQLSYTLPSDVRWSLHIEDSPGITLLPNASHLAFSGNLQDTGWNQTLSRLSFQHKDIFDADILVGMGEGERLEVDDGDLYYGARVRWFAKRIASLQFAYSQDKNSLPKDAIWWAENREDAHKGFKNQRLAVSVSLNGKLPVARGLEASVGWQQNRIDAARNTNLSAPVGYALDPTEILSQDLGGSGKTKKEVLFASASYRILAEYLIAIHAGQLRASLDSPSLQVCAAIDSSGACVDPTEKSKTFTVQQWTYGLGKLDKNAWSVLLEAHEERYDRLYQNYHFLNGNSPRQKNMRLVQARINWNW
ncbi:MAG: hypothetical protein H7249_02995 [Chitinophagaceae bacterium]|nr:hypothetical protein [Oligoflexus sp.]